MTENVTFRAEYAGYIDNKRVASLYKAYAEEGQPYVVVLDASDGPLTLTQIPSVFLDDEVDQDEADDLDRRNAIRWVEALAELVEKAQIYDEICADIAATEAAPAQELWDDGFEDFEDSPENGVRSLRDVDTFLQEGLVWLDRQGDAYTVIDGRWHFQDRSEGEPGDWDALNKHGADLELLDDWGPYRREAKKEQGESQLATPLGYL